MYIAATDEHDEHGVLISDVFCNAAVRRKIAEKRMKKLDLALKDLPAPKLEGPADAEVTLIGWGSTEGVIREAVEQLNASGVRANQLHFKYLLPFHSKEAIEILKNCKRTICVEMNSTGQFARHLRAETGHAVNDKILKYDGEPFEPGAIADAGSRHPQGREALARRQPEPKRARLLITTCASIWAKRFVPGQITKADGNGFGEPVWKIEIVNRDSGEKRESCK